MKIPFAVAMSGFQAAGFSPTRIEPALIIACCEVDCGGFRSDLIINPTEKKSKIITINVSRLS